MHLKPIDTTCVLQLVLVNSYESGAMQQLWMAARQTNLQFNLVGFRVGYSESFCVMNYLKMEVIIDPK